jgi:hypothetical protein
LPCCSRVQSGRRSRLWETFSPVARLEAIRIWLAFVSSKEFKLHQMDVKSAFLNGVIQEEVYVRQPPGFENLKYPDRLYNLSKALYGLNHSIDFLYVQIYVDDIIFGGPSHTLVSRFQEMMESEFQMSMMGELTFFLGIQVKQGTFVHQAK